MVEEEISQPPAALPGTVPAPTPEAAVPKRFVFTRSPAWMQKKKGIKSLRRSKAREEEIGNDLPSWLKDEDLD